MKLLSIIILISIVLNVFPPGILAADPLGTGNRSVTEWFEDSNNQPHPNTENDDLEENVEVITPGLSEDESEEVSIGTSTPNLFVVSLQLLGGLAVILLLFFFLMKFINGRSSQFQNSKLIHSIGGVGVGSNRSIQMIRAGNRVFVVGVGESISLLKEITDPLEIKAMEKQTSEKDVFDKSLDKVSRWIRTKKDKNQDDENMNQEAFRRILQDELGNASDSQKKLYKALEEKQL